jgi:hypothetical protein
VTLSQVKHKIPENILTYTIDSAIINKNSYLGNEAFSLIKGKGFFYFVITNKSFQDKGFHYARNN